MRIKMGRICWTQEKEFAKIPPAIYEESNEEKQKQREVDEDDNMDGHIVDIAKARDLSPRQT